MTEFNSEAYIGVTTDMESRPRHRSGENDCGPQEHSEAEMFTQQAGAASHLVQGKPFGDVVNHCNHKESMDKVVNDVNLNKAYQAYSVACRERDCYKEQLEKTKNDFHLYKQEAGRLQAQLNAKQEFGKQLKHRAEEGKNTVHYAEDRPYEQVYNVASTEVSQRKTRPVHERFRTKCSSPGERSELEVAYQDLQEEFKKLHMVVRKQSNLLRAFLRPKSPFTYPESIPIQCTDMEDSIQVTAHTRLPRQMAEGLAAVDNSQDVTDHHKQTLASFGSRKGTSPNRSHVQVPTESNMECRTPLAVLAAVPQADDSLLMTVESLSTLGLKRPPADMEYLENLISEDDDLTGRRGEGRAHEVGNFASGEHHLITSMEPPPDSPAAAGVVPGVGHNLGVTPMNAFPGCNVPKDDDNLRKVLHCNELEEMCLNSQSSDGSQFFFPSQQLMGSDFLYMPSDDNLR
ncbi:TRAF family member-associated NF-kappa-B activator [Petromyzon marinus]|uniref:TRAF family member-associated NF-kappa-B activator n=1 Tax=Petromyzon marinus TaxID=7757 RepID=UPI003F71367E